MPPHALSDLLAGDCDGAIQRRGAEYFRTGRVRITHGSAVQVTANVRGSSAYRVQLLRAGPEITATCTCPYFEIDLCKHIWATVLAADARQLLRGDGRSGRVRLVHGGEDDDFEDDFDDEDDLGEEDDDEGHGPRGVPIGSRRVMPTRDTGAMPTRSPSPGAVRNRDGVLSRGPDAGATRDPSGRPTGSPGAGAPRGASWRRRLAELHEQARSPHPPAQGEWGAGRQLLYVVDVERSRTENGLCLEIFCHDRKQDGTWSKPRSRYLLQAWVQQLPSAEDRQLLACLKGAVTLFDRSGGLYAYSSLPSSTGYYAGESVPFRYRVPDALVGLTLPLICRSGRGRLRMQPQDDEPAWQPLSFAEQETWDLRLAVRRAGAAGFEAASSQAADPEAASREAGDSNATGSQATGSKAAGHYELRGELACGPGRLDLSAPQLLLHAGFLFLSGRVARLDHHGAFEWIPLLRGHGPLLAPLDQGEALVGELLRQPGLPPLDLPEELRYEEVALPARPRLSVKLASRAWQRDRLEGRLSFDYGGEIVASGDAGRYVIRAAERRALLRDTAAELGAAERLRQLGWRAPPSYAPASDRSTLELPSSRLPQIVRELTAEGWHVEAHGKVYRSPGRFALGVSSGVDWFELHGTLEFGNTVARLPELLAAVKRGEGMVRLGDGSFGLLPEKWLERYGLLAGLGSVQDDHVRFTRSQVGLLDALLAPQPDVERDTIFSQACAELRSFAGIEPADPPAGFRGELRPYQKEGLGWTQFLRRFGFGGCLADDMGLGKTVQVLALLEARRQLRQSGEPGRSDGTRPSGRPGARAGARGRVGSSERAGPSERVSPSTRIGPSLVVVPKSLLFNWKVEAARFAPRLRVLDHTGPERSSGKERFEDYDLILTTYGTLRQDAADFRDVRFDYVILDEAQAIKNADSASAKAARLLEADHRLALSGTPIQNHLGELWSLMEFLNPGLLGAASVFRLTQGAGHDPDEDTRKLLAQALRPFILRRTKEQVVRELPPKVEQTLYCELATRQRRLYDELRDHYRGTLLERIEREGLARSKIQILEALLRLRQAALHPGLIDERRSSEPAAKLETLLPRLEEVLEEGHKVLVFSQFTRMLGILRESLDRESVPYEYLDGRTRDREGAVTRFQTDADCKLFLISLKAGGLGLNLTAAQYVFLLDPWWNPAVEAQAIDRAHRIGQSNQVFAYRLIARDTIEEKVLELQSHKRDLAEAIVGADKSLIRDLRREDLEQLLS